MLKKPSQLPGLCFAVCKIVVIHGYTEDKTTFVKCFFHCDSSF